MTSQEYAKIAQRHMPKSNTALNCARAFLVGGGICGAGQLLFDLLTQNGWDETMAKGIVSASLITLGVALTAVGVYDKLARKAGAGSLVPITGFANSMSSAAIEFQSEGYVVGVGAKLFSIAGPVLVYGVTASVLYGAMLWGLHLLGFTFF